MRLGKIKRQISSVSKFCDEKCSNVKSFWRSSQNHFVLALICSLYTQLTTVSKACFKRRASHVPNALETIDNEAFQLII
jgi:hypothetical protein